MSWGYRQSNFKTSLQTASYCQKPQTTSNGLAYYNIEYRKH